MFTSISHCETLANSVHGKFYKSSCIKWRLFVISWWSRVEILAGSRFRVLKEHSTKNILRCKQEIVLTLGYLRSLKRQFFLDKEELLIEVCKIPYRTTPCCLSQADA